MARTSRSRQNYRYGGGRVVGNLAYDERYAERRAPRRESEQREQPREEFIRPPRRQEKRPSVRACASGREFQACWRSALPRWPRWSWSC